MSSLNNKNCLVTGATRGMGFAIARLLAQSGANVVICGRTEAATQHAVAELRTEAGNKVKGKAADVSNYKQVADLFAFIGQEVGSLDVLVNNAGIGVFGSVGELPLEQWKAVLETNLYGMFYCVREALAGFETRGGGHIVNIGSLAGAHAFAGGAAYNASKFAVMGFSEAVMQDLRMKNVRVSHVMPGSTNTEFGGADGTAEWKIWPEDIAQAVKMLLEMPERTLVSRIELRPSQPKR